MTKALAGFEICTETTDGRNGRNRKVFTTVKLYREPVGLVWRVAGELGDEVESLPRPDSVAQAKMDALAVYGAKLWHMRHNWK